MESVKVEAIRDYDLTQIISPQDIHVFESKDSNMISIQVEWKNLTGTLDAAVQVIQKNDSSFSWLEVPNLNNVMSEENGSSILQIFEWGGESAGVRIDMNGCTGGSLSIVTIGKNK